MFSRSCLWTCGKNAMNKLHLVSTMMKILGVILPAVMILWSSIGIAEEARSVRVLVWDEQQPEQAEAYPTFLRNAIADNLNSCQNIRAIPVHLDMPGQGLDPATLDATDVIVWWSHRRHGDVKGDRVDDVVRRVLDGRLGLIALHSSHFAQAVLRMRPTKSSASLPRAVQP